MLLIIKIILKGVILLSVAFILLLVSGFLAVRFGWTNIAGEEDSNSYEYNLQAKINRNIIEPAIVEDTFGTTTFHVLPQNKALYGIHEQSNWCRIAVAQNFSIKTALVIFEAYHKTHSEILLNNMLLAMKLRLIDREVFSQRLAICQNSNQIISPDIIADRFLIATTSPNLYTWQNGEPWQIIKKALVKDKKIIYEIAQKVDIQPRLLLSVAIVEQLRLYYTQRELFEKVFKPLEILANANKMAWGIMAIKEKMAIETENHLKDKNSPYYLGKKYAVLLDFPEYKKDIKKQQDKERYRRLTDNKTHYYSYLYGSLIIKQLQVQWQRAGYSLEYRPEIIATLFNIGFHHSEPKKDPKVGGSTIEIDGEKYYFGSLAFEFYYSGELSNEFPYE